MIYPNMNALINAIGYQGYIYGNDLAPEVSDLFKEAEEQLPYVDILAGNQAAQVTPNGPGAMYPYRLDYDANEPDQEWKLASMLHELIHVSCARNYQRINNNIPPVIPGMWAINMNFNNVNDPVQLDPQSNVLRANLDDLRYIAQHDTELPDDIRHHLLDRRIDYADYLCLYEYDTCLTDMIVYLQLNDYRFSLYSSTTFSFLKRLVREASSRRHQRHTVAIRVDRAASFWEVWKW